MAGKGNNGGEIMPKLKWEELNDVIHRTKGHLTKLAAIELKLREIKKDILTDLDKLHTIVLSQLEDNDGESTGN